MESGTRLGAYEIIEQLGAGGMGEVYLAEDTRLGRRVAIKVLPEALSSDPDLLHRMQREARNLAALDHPNIVSLFSIEQEEGVHFLTMAYVEGQTLAELLPEEGFPSGRVFDLAVPLADALSAAHERGIVHRDLKPANIMVESDGRVRVLDFGIAKQLQSTEVSASTELTTATMTELGRVVGTLPYLSPEQAEGKTVDARSDIFSMGIVLYELATGARPFGGDTPTALLSSILKDVPPPVHRVNRSVPARLGSVIGRCLEKAPADRYQTAAALRDDLVRARQAVPRPTARTLAVAAVFLVITVAGWALWRGRGPSTEIAPAAVSGEVAVSSLAVLPLRNASGASEQDYFADGMTEALITDLSKIGSLKVISRSASMRYRETNKSLREIGQELGVQAVVEGAVMREGDRVGITVQLIETASDRNLWAERYERELTSVLSLQGELARAIAEQVEVTLTPEEERLLAAARPVSTEAYEAYLKGMSYWNELNPANLDNAMRYFELALQHDPEYAPAHAGVALVWVGRQQMGITAPAVAMSEAKAAATRAVELDDTLAAAHSSLATIAGWGEWDWSAARSAFERALQIQPNDPLSQAYLSHVLTFLGEPEAALRHAARAVELDPFDPLIEALYGATLMMTGRQQEATATLRESLETTPDNPAALESLWASLVAQEEWEQAFQVARTRFAVTGEQELVAALDAGRDAGGYREAMARAVAVLDGRPAERFLPALLAARIYFGADDPDGAFGWIERGIEIHDPSLPYLTVVPVPAGFRADPRYARLVEALGL